MYSILQCGDNPWSNFGRCSFFDQHVSAVVRSCFFHVRSLSKVRPYLTRKAANSIAVSLILSKLDYCNSLLAGSMQHKMQQLELSQNVRKLTTLRPFSDNLTGCPFMTASTIKFFLPHTCQFMKTLLSTSLSSLISTPPLALSDRLQDLSLMFLGQEILRQNDTVSEPSGMLLYLSGMHCLEASGKVILFSPSKLF